MENSWKSNWPETKRHFIDWWNHRGLVLGSWYPPLAEPPRRTADQPPPPRTPADEYLDPAMRARRIHADFSGRVFPADTLPCVHSFLGAGSLALFLGSEPGFSWETVWFEPSMADVENPETCPPLVFDPENRWWRLTLDTLRECSKLGAGQYRASCPDLVENIDILSALRDPQTLMVDLVDRPDWVKQKVDEINEAWVQAYRHIYEIIKLEDGSSFYGAFALWGPGRTAKVQCDACAMFSTEMFREFVQPALARQCEWLDHSMYHLDGTQCICHLDALFEIESLDAIEWTPQAGIEGGGSPRWHDLYRRILDAGKSVQAIGVAPSEVIPLLDAVGPKGMYIMVSTSSARELEELAAKVEPYRK